MYLSITLKHDQSNVKVYNGVPNKPDKHLKKNKCCTAVGFQYDFEVLQIP